MATFFGDNNPNQFFGTSSDDIFHLYGGNDDVHPGSGRETVYGGEGYDYLYFWNSPAAVNVNLAINTHTGGWADGDAYFDIEEIHGSAFSDSITGTGGSQALHGGQGNDRLEGRDGNDTLYGGNQKDYLDGGPGDDLLDGGLDNDFYIIDSPGDLIQGEVPYANGGGIDTVRVFYDGYVQPTNIELVRITNLTDLQDYSATGNDAPGTLVGNAGDNTLTGRGGNDQINGNDGEDVLIGNTGRDTLVGGAGDDTFVYSSVSESRAGSANRDVINGFENRISDVSEDIIDLSAVDAISATAADDAFTFIGSARFSGTAGEMRTQGLGGPNAILLEMDVTGDGVANMQIFVNLTTFMQESDFIL